MVSGCTRERPCSWSLMRNWRRTRRRRRSWSSLASSGGRHGHGGCLRCIRSLHKEMCSVALSAGSLPDRTSTSPNTCELGADRSKTDPHLIGPGYNEAGHGLVWRNGVGEVSDEFGSESSWEDRPLPLLHSRCRVRRRRPPRRLLSLLGESGALLGVSCWACPGGETGEGVGWVLGPLSRHPPPHCTPRLWGQDGVFLKYNNTMTRIPLIYHQYH